MFGEPIIDILHESDGRIAVRVKGRRRVRLTTGEIRANDTKGIATWFIDTDYNRKLFVRHAYFLGANDPCKSPQDRAAVDITRRVGDIGYRAGHGRSRSGPRPADRDEGDQSLRDEVMKVFRCESRLFHRRSMTDKSGTRREGIRQAEYRA